MNLYSMIDTCERINDTFVVKCVEKIQALITVAIKHQPFPTESFWSFGISELINVLLVCISLALAYWGFKIAKDATFIANEANKLANRVAVSTQVHNAQSIRPALTWGIVSDSKLGCKVKISNAGLGPAHIENLSLYIEDQEFSFNGIGHSNIDSKSINDLIFKRYEIPIDELWLSHSSIGEGSVIGVGESFEWGFLISGAPSNCEMAATFLREELLLWVEYHDFYGNDFEEDVRFK